MWVINGIGRVINDGFLIFIFFKVWLYREYEIVFICINKGFIMVIYCLVFKIDWSFYFIIFVFLGL